MSGDVDAVCAPVRTDDAVRWTMYVVVAFSARHPIIIFYVYKVLYNAYAGCRSHAHARDNAIVDARADGPINDQLKYTHTLTRTYTLTQANTHTRARLYKRVHTLTH